MIVFIDRKKVLENFESLQDDEKLRNISVNIDRYHLRFFTNKLKNWGYYEILGRICQGIEIKGQSDDFVRTDKTLNDLIVQALQFYKDLDASIYKKIDSALKNPKIIKEFYQPGERKDISRVCFRRRFLQVKRKIKLCPMENLLGDSTVVHEFAHVASQKFQKGKRPKTEIISEIPSVFMEMVFVDYLLNIGQIEKSEYDKFFEYQNYRLKFDITGMLVEKDMCDMLPLKLDKQNFVSTMNFVFKEEKHWGQISRSLNMMKDLSDEKTKAWGEYRCRYVLGRVVSMIMFDDYKKNPQETMSRFKYFLNHSSEMKPEPACKLLLGEKYKEKIDNKFLSKGKTK